MASRTSFHRYQPSQPYSLERRDPNAGRVYSRVSAQASLEQSKQLNKTLAAWTRSLGNAGKWADWSRFCSNNLENFDLINCSTALQAASSVSKRDQEEFFQRYNDLISRILAKMEPEIQVTDARNVSSILHALAKMNHKDEAVLLALRQRAKAIIGTFGTQALANTAWSLVQLKIHDGVLVQAICDRAKQIIQSFTKSEELSSLANSLAKLIKNGEDSSIFQTIASRVEWMTGRVDFNAQHCANLAWGLGKGGNNDPRAFAALSKKAGEIMGSFKAQELSSLAHGFASAGISDPALFKAIGDNASKIMQAFKPFELVTLAWSFAETRIDDKGFFQEIFKELRREERGKTKLDDLDYVQLSNLLWSIARLRLIDDRDFLANVLEITLDNKSKIDINELSRLTWSFAVIFNLYDLSDSPSSDRDLIRLNELLLEIDAKLNGMFQNKENIRIDNRNQLHQTLLYLERFHPRHFSPQAYVRVKTVADETNYLNEEGLNRDQPSLIHQTIHESAERILGKFLPIEQFRSGYYLDTILHERRKIALEVIGLSHFLDSGAMPGEEALRERILKADGWTTIELVTQNWRDIQGLREKEAYLERLLPRELFERERDLSLEELERIASFSSKQRRGEERFQPAPKRERV